MSLLRIAYSTDYHYTEEANAEVGLDSPWFRIYSTASSRTREFFRLTKPFNPDIYLFDGDLINSGAADPPAQMTQFKADVDAEGIDLSNNGYFLCGNHDYVAYGNDVDEFFSGSTGIGTNYRAAGAGWWPNAMTNQCAWYDDVGGFRLIGLATAINAGGNFDDEAYGSAIGDNQRDWLNEGGGPLDTSNPIVVFSHAHLTVTTGRAFAYNNEDDGTILTGLRADFTTAGVKAVICGHYHKGLIEVTGANYEIINNVRYYGLRGSVIGRHLTDISNFFYVIDIDSTLGVTVVRYFRYTVSTRGRTDPYNIGKLLGKTVRGRGRYSR